MAVGLGRGAFDNLAAKTQSERRWPGKRSGNSAQYWDGPASDSNWH
jgi:hypothetical protein